MPSCIYQILHPPPPLSCCNFLLCPPFNFPTLPFQVIIAQFLISGFQRGHCVDVFRLACCVKTPGGVCTRVTCAGGPSTPFQLSEVKQTKIIYTNGYIRRWVQTTPQRSDQTVTILVNLEQLLCFNSFLAKLGLKIRNIRPIKMAHRMTPYFKLWRHICWRHSHVNSKLLNPPIFYTGFERAIQGKLKAEKIFRVCQIWVEIWHFEFG